MVKTTTYSLEEKLKIKDMLDAGFKRREIADAIGRGYDSLVSHIGKNLSPQGYDPHLSSHVVYSKFTEEERLQMIEMKKTMSTKQIADFFKVRVSAISCAMSWQRKRNRSLGREGPTAEERLDVLAEQIKILFELFESLKK